MSAKAFPPSVLRRIMYHLRNDHSALNVCMYTCKTWFECAAPFIYVTLRLYSHGKLEVYEEKFRRYPYLLQHVRHLEIDGCNSDETREERQEWMQEIGIADLLPELESGDSSDEDEGWAWLFDALPLLAELTNLSCLTLKFMTWTRLPVVVQQYFLVPRPNMTDMILCQVVFPDFRTFVLFLNQYPSLTNLHVSEVNWGDDVYFPPDDACLSSLRSLVNMGTNLTSSFSRLLAEKVAGGQLQSLTCGILSFHHLYFASQLHKLLGPSVQDLELVFFIGHSAENGRYMAIFLEPTFYTNIRSLQIGVVIADNNQDLDPRLPWASAVISQIRSSHISDIIIHLAIETRNDVSRELQASLGPIDDIIQSPTFLSLRKLVFAPYFFPDSEKFESDEMRTSFAQLYINILSRSFPNAAARGILQFDTDSDWEFDTSAHTEAMQLHRLLKLD